MPNRTPSRYALCVKNKGCDDLLLGKVYAILKDTGAKKESYLRVVDESGEDYLYPESYFFVVSLPADVRRALNRTRKSSAA